MAEQKFKSERQRKHVMSILEKRHGGGVKLEAHIQKKETEHQNTDTTNIVATKKRRMAVLEKLKGKSPVVSGNEIQHITNSLNRKEFSDDENRRFADEANEIVTNHKNGIMLNEEATKKALEFLTRPLSQRTLGTRERDILDDFREINLDGWIDDDNPHRLFFRPQWKVIANDGEEFSYLFDGNGIEITG